MDISQLAAAGTPNVGALGLAITYFIVFVDSFLVPLLFALAFISFLYGVYTYFFSISADAEKRNKGKAYVLYGIIGFFLMVSVWGIVNIFTNTLGFSGYTRPKLPLFGSSQTTTSAVPTNKSTVDNSGFSFGTFFSGSNTNMKVAPYTQSASDCFDSEHWDAATSACVKN